MSLRELEHDKITGFINAWKVEPQKKIFFILSVFNLMLLSMCIKEKVFLPISIIMMVIVGIPSFFFCFYIKNKGMNSDKMFFQYLGLYFLGLAFSASYCSYLRTVDRFGKHFLNFILYLFFIIAVLLFTVLFLKRKIKNGYFLKTRKPTSATIIKVFAALGVVIGTSISTVASESTDFYVMGVGVGILSLLMVYAGTYYIIKYYCCVIINHQSGEKGDGPKPLKKGDESG